MSKVFMTVIGTGRYQEVPYTLDGFVDTNRFVQKSILNILKKKGIEFDRIICFVTEKSYEINWEKFAREGLEDEGMKPYLQKNFPNSKIITQEIPLGSNEKELLTMFNTMYDSLEENDEVTLDVTHGFRSMPMLFLPLLNYAKELKNVSVDAIYYGAFDGDGQEKEIINLNIYNEILNWANAAHSFVNYGVSTEMVNLANERNSKAIKSNKDMSYTYLNKMAAKINSFTSAMQTSRGGIKGESIASQYKSVMRIYDSTKKQDILPPLEKLVEHAVKSLPNFDDNKPVQNGINTIKWCVEKNMVQQGYTALQETLVTYACFLIKDKGAKVDFQVAKEREEITKGIAAINVEKDPREEIRLTAIQHEKEKKGKISSLEEQTILEIPLEICILYDKISLKRNDINHFGMRNNPLSPMQLSKNLSQFFEEFLNLIG